MGHAWRAEEDRFSRCQAARAQEEDREALQRAMLTTREGISVARGSHDVLFEPAAQLRVSTAVFPVGRGENVAGLDALPGPGRATTEVRDNADIDSEADAGAEVGSVEFDEAVLEPSQLVAPRKEEQFVHIPGCPTSLARAYMALFMDGSITEELVGDRFGGEVLGLFLARRGEGPVTTATVAEETRVNEVGGVAEPAHPLLVLAHTLQDESAGTVVADSAEMFVDGEGGCGSVRDLQEDMNIGRGRPTGGEQLGGTTAG